NFAGEAAGPVSAPSSVFTNETRLSGSPNGTGFSSTALTTEKIAVLTPMPRVKAAIAVTVKPGLSRNILSACFRSLTSECIGDPRTDDRAPVVPRRGQTSSSVTEARNGNERSLVRRWAPRSAERAAAAGLLGDAPILLLAEAM